MNQEDVGPPPLAATPRRPSGTGLRLELEAWGPALRPEGWKESQRPQQP